MEVLWGYACCDPGWMRVFEGAAAADKPVADDRLVEMRRKSSRRTRSLI